MIHLAEHLWTVSESGKRNLEEKKVNKNQMEEKKQEPQFPSYAIQEHGMSLHLICICPHLMVTKEPIYDTNTENWTASAHTHTWKQRDRERYLSFFMRYEIRITVGKSHNNQPKEIW